VRLAPARRIAAGQGWRIVFLLLRRACDNTPNMMIFSDQTPSFPSHPKFVVSQEPEVICPPDCRDVHRRTPSFTAWNRRENLADKLWGNGQT
jgi:hypothetical protein